MRCHGKGRCLGRHRKRRYPVPRLWCGDERPGPTIHPEKNAAKAFIARNSLKLIGPVTATLRVRCPAGVGGDLSWRTSEQADCPAAQRVVVEVLRQAVWQVVKVQLPMQGQLPHVRLAFTGKASPDIQTIELGDLHNKASGDWSIEAKDAHQ